MIPILKDQVYKAESVLQIHYSHLQNYFIKFFHIQKLSEKNFKMDKTIMKEAMIQKYTLKTTVSRTITTFVLKDNP